MSAPALLAIILAASLVPQSRMKHFIYFERDRERIQETRFLSTSAVAGAQYHFSDDDEKEYVKEGWVARRWDKAVMKRFHLLLQALGKKFDGRIEGINLPESSVG